MTVIVEEMPQHYAAVRQLTIDAFAHSDLGYNGEADLIEAIHEHCEISLSLVAIHDNEVVGHILFSPATIRTAWRSGVFRPGVWSPARRVIQKCLQYSPDRQLTQSIS
jgi:predicted N-acetyltransferase YhbS